MKGYLVVNLGSPASAETGDVKKYLDQFLMDPFVLDIPWLIRRLLLSFIILPFRSPKTAALYRKIWSQEGSPLVVISRRQGRALQKLLRAPVAVGMRYGSPSIADAFTELEEQGIQEVSAALMYPQYTQSSFETALRLVEREAEKRKMTVTVVAPFFAEKSYLKALADSIRPHLTRNSRVLFSYHGLPERHVKKADPTGCCFREGCCELPGERLDYCYRAQAFHISREVASQLKLKSERFSTSFQSRLGRDPWLLPFSVDAVKALAAETPELVVVCPSFTADCLETLEEAGMQLRDLFLSSGGKKFTLVPCLNDRPDFMRFLSGQLKQTRRV